MTAAKRAVPVLIALGIFILTLTARAYGQESLLPDVQAARAGLADVPTPAQLGELLHAVALKHAADGWGLSAKPNGNNCPSPVGRIACDILHHRPTNTLWDVLIDAGGRAEPTWQHVEYHGDPAGRPWLAPVGTAPPPVPDPPPTPDPPPAPDVDLGPVLAKLEALEQHLVAQEGQLAALAKQVDALALSLEEHREEARQTRAVARSILKDWRTYLATAIAAIGVVMGSR